MQEFTEKKQDVLDKEKRAKNALTISIATGVIFTMIAVSVMLINKSVRFDLSMSLMLLTSLFSFLSVWQNRRGNSDFGILMVITGLVLTIIGRVFIQKGLAIPTGITNIILVSVIATYTLPEKWIERVIGVSFTAAIATIVIDEYTRNIPTAASPQTGMYIAMTLGVLYIFFIARQFPKFNLRTKLVIGFLSLSTIPLLILGWQTYTTSRDIVQEQIKAGLRENANSTSRRLEDYLNEQVSILSIESKLGDVVKFVALPKTQRRKGSEDEQHALNALQTFAKKDEHIISLSLIDENGLNVLDTIPSNINSTYKDQIFFAEPLNTQKPYLSNVLFPRKFSNPILYIAVPIINAKNQSVGVLLATYNAKSLQSILEITAESRSSGTEYIILIDGVYFINLGHSSKPDLLYKSYLNIDGTTISDLQSKNILIQGDQNSILAPQLQLVESIRGMGPQTSFQSPSLENNNELAESSAVRVPNTQWIVVSSQPVSAITTLTQDQTRTTVTSGALITIFAAIIALVVSNLFTKPIIHLTEVAEKFATGDFSQKTSIKSNDEIGLLGKTVNTMADEIQELIGSLEKRVEERTADLERATHQSEQRALELQTIAEIARYISTEKDLENLLPLITRTVSEQFDFYHVGIFLLNEQKNFAVLRAANSPGGQILLQRHHKLEVGQTGIVGNVTATGVPRIVLDTGADAVYFNNPDLPNTHSEMALPLSVRGEIIGALDVQSTVSNAFTNSDISVLSLLADQIAIAIENARLLEETKRALAESQSVFREYVAQAWQSKSASNVLGYYQTMTGGKLVTKKSAEDLENMATDNDRNVLSVPIQLRGQAIGTLNIRMNKSDEQLSTEEVNIIHSVTERLGLALENARLFEETSTRASRERLVTDITTKIRGTNDPQEMIKTAMEELKRALGASRIEIVSKKSASQMDK